MSNESKTPWTGGKWSSSHPAGENMQGYSQPVAVHSIFENERPMGMTLICGCFGDVRGGVDSAIANGRLIAEAPNLYQALLDSHQLLVMLSDQVGKEQRSAIYDQCAWNSAALAKARGQL